VEDKALTLMSLIKDIGALPKNPNLKCPITLTCSENPNDEQDLLTLVADKNWPASALSKELERVRGWRVTAEAIRRHRRRICACDHRERNGTQG